MAAVSGIGTIFNRWDGGAWVALADITSISGPDKSRETIDVTTLSSTDGYREFIASLKDGGSVTLSMNFTRASYDLIDTDYESDTLKNYEIILPDAENTSFEFEGLVTELGLDTPIDDKITADVTIKISGAVVINSGAQSDSPGV